MFSLLVGYSNKKLGVTPVPPNFLTQIVIQKNGSFLCAKSLSWQSRGHVETLMLSSGGDSHGGYQKVQVMLMQVLPRVLVCPLLHCPFLRFSHIYARRELAGCPTWSLLPLQIWWQCVGCLLLLGTLVSWYMSHIHPSSLSLSSLSLSTCPVLGPSLLPLDALSHSLLLHPFHPSFQAPSVLLLSILSSPFSTAPYSIFLP